MGDADSPGDGDPKFKRSHGGVFEHNLVVFDRRTNVFVNIGPNTAPETFTVRHNAWFQTDGRRPPKLPAPEVEGVYQVDPKMIAPGTPAMRVGSKDPRLKGLGADAYERPKADR